MSKATPTVQTPPAPIETSTPMEQFLEANFKKLVFLFIAAIVAVILYGITSYTSHANAVAAGEAFASAKTIEDCDLVISEYSGTSAAGNALLLKADLLWAQNKKDSSVAALREFSTKHSDHPLLPQALLGLATKLESMGEAAEAQPVFERITTEFANSDVAALAQLRLGDIKWSQGKEEEAKAAYESVPANFANADSAFIDQSESRMKWITAKLPTKEVDGPPKPKVVTPPPSAPGAPQLNLNSTTLNPTLMPGGAAPQIQVVPSTPGAPTAPKIQVTPTPAAPAPKIEVTPAPKVEVQPAPAAPKIGVTPTPSAPPAPKAAVKPAVEAPKEATPAAAPAAPAPAEAPVKAP